MIGRFAAACCARAVSGHATAAPGLPTPFTPSAAIAAPRVTA